jgi:hypothetical protein
MVLIWTRCTVRAPTADPYKTHLWDPNNEGSVAFSAPILDRINAAPDRTEDGPFCSGHAWILDQDKNPKLLVVGGEDRGDNDSMTPVAYEDQDPAPGFQNPCVGTSFVCGLHKVYWFDPLVAGPDNAWSDSPPDLSEGRWYPSVTTYLNAGQDEFRPMVVGGTAMGYREPSLPSTPCPAIRYDHWWTPGITSNPPFAQWIGGPWMPHSSPYLWQYYPRTFQITGPQLMTAGHAIECENDAPPFGGNPTSVLTPDQIWSHGPSPNPDDSTLTGATGGAWHYANGAILHTLNNLSYTEVDPERRYDKDRILITGGSQEFTDGSVGIPAQPHTHELYSGQWHVKADPMTPRVFSNWVIIPDGTLLLVGGGNNNSFTGADTYFGTVERFSPGSPSDLGIWATMASRPDVVVGAATLPPPARAYHSVALLLQDGRVAVMGGAAPATSPWSNSAIRPWSSVEIYKPGYTLESSRLRITGTQQPSMAYGTPYHLTVNSPSRVAYASLIGISSITHHFDYGQRYVQLMATQSSGAGNVKVLAPPLKTMAPEGYYLLFVVEIRNGVHIPSKGVFVKLSL